MTGTQSAASSNAALQIDGSPVTLYNAVTFNASSQDQEIELKPGETVVVTITGGTGQVMVAGALGIGVNN